MGILDKSFLLIQFGTQSISLLEFLGVVTGLLAVWQASKERISNWIWGMLNAVFFFLLFYQSQLYSDMLLQAFFFGTSIFGLWRWTHPRSPQEEKRRMELKISSASLGERVIWILGIVFGTILLGLTMGRIQDWLPWLFPLPAAYPFPDAFITLTSIAAQILLTRKKLESWLLWIIVDLCSMVVFWGKDLTLVASEYLVFFVIAVMGFLFWIREWRRQEV